MNKIFILVVLALACCVNAEDSTKKDSEEVKEIIIKQEDKTEYEKNTIIDFKDLLVIGDFSRPEGSYLKIRRKTNFKSLIELRSNFRTELKKAAADL